MTQTIDGIFNILNQTWTLVMGSWILSYGVLISILTIIINIYISNQNK